MAHFPADSAVDINKNNTVNNYNNVRGRNPSFSNIFSQSSSVVSKASSISYHDKMIINNNASDEEFRKPIDSSQLLYKDNSQVNGCVNKVIDSISTQEPQHVSNKVPALNISNLTYIDCQDQRKWT